MSTHHSIQLKDITLTFGEKRIFTGINAIIHDGDRIAIIGPNGAGKSSLLRILAGQIKPTEGSVIIPSGLHTTFVAQHPDSQEPLSGGQQTFKQVTHALAHNTDLLLLDEPTNHLDSLHKKKIGELLDARQGTALIITHDVSLLRAWPTVLWIVEHGKLDVFYGSYDDYLREREIKYKQLHARKEQLKKEERAVALAKQQEQRRAAESKKKGEKKFQHEKLARNTAKRRAEQTTSKIQSKLGEAQESIIAELSELHIPEAIQPHFDIAAIKYNNDTLEIRNGTVGYGGTVLVRDIALHVNPGERIALMGANGSGKSTLLKAMMRDSQVRTTGEWYLPPTQRIGYLDQFYSSIMRYKTPLDAIEQLMPRATHNELRVLLNRFLFRTNAEVNTPVTALSGGERVRLVLATIAAQSPSILLLDEITNNLDLASRAHVIEVLKEYPGTLIAVSHDREFLQRLHIETFYTVEQGTMR